MNDQFDAGVQRAHQNVHEPKKIVSRDVENLFTNVPVTEAIENIC